MKLSLPANLVLNLSLACPFFPERFQPITAAAMCTVLEPGAFNAEFQYFIPLFHTTESLIMIPTKDEF